MTTAGADGMTQQSELVGLAEREIPAPPSALKHNRAQQVREMNHE